jgi:hypothetical protein
MILSTIPILRCSQLPVYLNYAILNIMSSLEEKFQQACDARDIPGVVLLAQSADGESDLLIFRRQESSN